jgi:MHS family proline/betaine transporter-like MFS transporter
LQKTNFKRIFFSSYLGNTLETYDFVLCGILATKMSQIFFPSSNEVSSLLLMLIAYGVGFVFRPLGAIIFGYIGDVKGRKTALFYSLLGMSISTGGCGLLPSYETIGVFSSLLFFVLRVLQGICIGGESQGGSTFVVEHFWKNSPAAFGAFYATSNGLGALLATLASLSFLVINSEDPHMWRYPFILGALVGVVGFYIRRNTTETPLFKASASISIFNPIKAVFKNNQRGCLRVFLYVALISSITHFGFTFVNIFLSTFVRFEETTALTFACLGTLLAMGGVAITGLILKRFQNKLHTLINVGAGGAFVMAPMVMALMQTGKYTQIITALLMLALFTGLLCGTAPYFIALHFKHANRYSGSALLNNLAQGFIAGFFPSIGLFLLNQTYTGPVKVILPGLYLSFLSSLFIGFNYYCKDLKYHEEA